MNSFVQQFVEQFERDAALAGTFRAKLGKAEIAFLEQVWGPAFQYDFAGLKAEYPFKDFKGGQRYADFVYIRGGMKLVIEIDGFSTHARDVSPSEFEDHLMRQNDLILSGWLLLRFSANQVFQRPLVCQRQVKQAIGHWWSVAQVGTAGVRSDMWRMRAYQIMQIARQQGGKIRAADLTALLGAHPRAATKWLKKLAQEGALLPEKMQQRTTRYVMRYSEDSA
jgi:very-short-patch-repair endonuclease